MPKRKSQAGEDRDGDKSIPLPIQAFFWRQTSPFIRPKRGKLCEAAVVSLERVVVQNILHGASPSLCEAIQSVSRWKVIQAAFPHVMHACSALLSSCKLSDTGCGRLGSSESKLLYILHWIILDAASECEDLESDPSRNGASVQMHSLTTMQLFVYLFAPLIHLLEISDFQTLKLENGLQLWQPLWDYRQPDITCFAAPVKPQRNILKAQRTMFKANTNAANIYIGKGTSRENLILPFAGPASRRTSYNDQSPEHGAPLVTMSDICHWSVTDSQSVNIEMVCEFCNTVMPNTSGKSCQCGKKNSVYSISSDFRFSSFPKKDSIDREFNKNRLISAVTSGMKGPSITDILSASYFDVAVLRCLFCLHWSEDGIFWALRYIQQRMLEVCDEYSRRDYSERERSYSLPIPDIQVLQKNSTITPTFQKFLELKKQRKADAHEKSKTKPQTLHTIPSGVEITENNLKKTEDRKQPPFKRNRVDELKMKFEKSTESKHISQDKPTSPQGAESCPVGDQEGEKTKLPAYKGFLSVHQGLSNSLKIKLQDNKRPLSQEISDQESVESSNESSASSQLGDMSTGNENKNPVIMVTEHTQKHQDKMTAMLHKSHDENQADLSKLQKPSDKIPRSMTDSDICYQVEEDISEVSGSKYYIQDNGHLNYKVVLRAVHFISINQRSQRVCEVLLNIVNCLLDLDIIERKSDMLPKQGETTEEKKYQNKCDPAMGKMTAHGLAMDSLLSIFKSIGCPNGCGDGMRGSYGDHLRAKGHNCLQRLQRINPVLFRTYLRDVVKKMPVQETVDFLHAFLGFCVDPSSILQSNQSTGQGFFKSSQERMSSQSGFGNNFGHSIGGLGYRGVEGVLIANILKPFISKCVDNTRDLYSSENISMFCDVRQFIAYVKEIHGGTFRRVELSGLLDSFDKLKKKERENEEKLKKSISMRRTTSQTSESGDEKESSKNVSPASGEETGKPKKSLFKKKIKKSLAMQLYAASDSELMEEIRQNKQGTTTEDDSLSGSGITKRRFSKFHIGWRRTAKSDHEEDAMSDPHPLDRRDSKSEIQVPRAGLKGKMSFKTASHATISLLSASKRIQGGLKNLGKKMNKRGSLDGWKTKEHAQNDDSDLDLVLTREKKLVDKYLIKSGMLRFSFLLECCHPGSIPDPQLVAAMLELEAPVVARASFLLECAHFIHRCNHGDWPNWMRLNIPSFRNSASALQNRGQPSGYRRTLTLQKAAGRMFYSWAENLGCMLEYILAKEHKDRLKIISDVPSDAAKKELRICDEDEDFLDEGTVNSSGSSCPYALKMIACLVLQEITTFLRETFRDLPKGRSPRRDTPGPDRCAASRRWSSIVSSPIHSQSSESNMADMTHSASGVTVGSPGTGDRKISFAVLGEKSDSVHSSTTSLSVMDPGISPHTPNEERKGRRLAQGRPKLLKHFRRGSGANSSFRHNRSFRLKRQEGGSIKRFGSIKSRKVSSQSLQSDKVMEDDDKEDGESVLSEDNDPVEVQEADDFSMCRNMPWIRIYFYCRTYQDDNLPVAPTASRSTDHAPTGPTPTPRMFVTEINNKGKENTPFDTNISSKVQGHFEMQQISDVPKETSVKEHDRKTNGEDKPERPSTAGKLVRFAAEVSKQDGETSKDVKQMQNTKIAEGLRENTVSTEDTQMEMTMKVDITIVERDEKIQQEENKVMKGEITIIDKGEQSQKDEKKSKQSCKPNDDVIIKKDDNDDDDDIKDIDDNRFKENKSTNVSQSQNIGESSTGNGTKESGDKSQHGKQNSIHMCRNRDRYTAPSSLQIQSVLHDGSVYYTVGAESPRRSRSPSPSRSPCRSPSPFQLSSSGSLSRQKMSKFNKQDASLNKLNRLIRPSSANRAKKQKRRFSTSSSVSMDMHLNSESSDTYTSRKSKVYFEGETPPRQSIFTEIKIGNDVEITLKDEKPLSFDDLDSELIAIQESIRAKQKKMIITKIDLNSTVDSEESELQKQIEEKIKKLELNSKSLQTDVDIDSQTPKDKVQGQTSKDKVQGYVDLLEMYRTKCMTVSENCGCISDSLTTPRPVTPKRRNSFSRPLSPGKKAANKTLARRNSFHFEKPTAADDKISKTNIIESSKELFRSPSVVSMTTDSGFSFGADDSKVPSLCLTPGDSDVGSFKKNGFGTIFFETAHVCLTDRSEDNEEKPLLEMVCDHLPVNEVSANDIEDRVVNEEAGVDFKIVAKALEFSKPKPIKKKKEKEPVAPFAPLCFRLNARPPSGYLYYFAYGPDMNQSSNNYTTDIWNFLLSQSNISGPNRFDIVRVFDIVPNEMHGLDIEAGGFANIEFNPFCSVEGVIYQITPEELQLLDKHVGYPEHYTHLMLPVWMSNSTSPDQYGVAQYCVPAVMYIAQEKWLNKDETLNCDYALQQCIKSSDLVTPDYRDHMVNYCQPIPEQVVCVS